MDNRVCKFDKLHRLNFFQVKHYSQHQATLKLCLNNNLWDLQLSFLNLQLN